MRYYKKQIAPRLRNGDVRDHYTGGLPPEVKHALQTIARQEKKSVSWVLEEVIISFFDLPRPKYKRPDKI